MKSRSGSEGGIARGEGGATPETRSAHSRGERRGRRWLWWSSGLIVLVLALAILEAKTSWLQARLISDWAEEIGYELVQGPEAEPVPPAHGPYDLRLGYALLPEIESRLTARGFDVVARARASERLNRALELGLFPVYDEKSRAGLSVADRSGHAFFEARYPERVYRDFESIPEPVVRTLLFIENRELLDPGSPLRNPAVEWDRLAGSVVMLLGRRLGAAGSVAGASTLATQLEKFRHSPDGVTRAPRDKLAQMATASLRAYANGPRTEAARRRIVLDYLNSVPLAAISGYGEVIGLQDGLRVWYGLDPDRVSALLGGCEPLSDGEDVTEPGLQAEPPAPDGCGREPPGEASAAERGQAFRAVLSLMLAQRRPSYYLATTDGHAALQRLGDVYLGLIEEAGAVAPELIEEARAARLERLLAFPAPPPVSFLERKAATATRTHLLTLTGRSRLYELDRLDLSVGTPIDHAVQDSVTRVLLRLRDPEFVRRVGFGDRRLVGTGDPSKIVYSFVLHERTPSGNVVRVQTDNFDGPFDLNQSSRLELGSTAKLRTLVTYLEIVERLHRELSRLPPEYRRAAVDSLPDPLTRWAIGYLERAPDADLPRMLEAAMDRQYSASPAERFFTGGGTHVFRNFDSTHDGSFLTVRAGFRHSVNLVFVRLMRDIERFYRWRVPGASAQILSDPTDPRRQAYLDRFVEREGRIFVSRFYTKFRGELRGQILESLVAGRRMTPQRLAWTYRSVLPDAGLGDFSSFMRAHSPNTNFSDGALRDLFERTAAERFSLADQGYLASIHPLELWVARYLIENPEADRATALAASQEARRGVYGWLFSPRRRQAQDRSISVILELEAFLEIERSWRRLGYPFENLVPSFGTSIGSSGDRPDALAELVGILLNDGVRWPLGRVDWLRFAADTPFETLLGRRPTEGERALSSPVARVAREALLDVVAQGTARSIQGAARGPDGTALPIGGKTGTGDNQFRVFGVGGRVLETRILNRTATFVFFIGDRHYGVVTAHVPGQDAADFRFTSALPVRVLALLTPYLEPLLAD